MSKKQTLLEKFGGSKGIHEMAFGFHQRLLRDQHLRRSFRYLKVDDFVPLQQELFEVALGKPITKDKKVLEQLRLSFAVGQQEIPRFITHIIETLEKHGLASEERTGIINRVASFIEVITGEPYKPDTPSTNHSSNKSQNTNKGDSGAKEVDYESCSI